MSSAAANTTYPSQPISLVVPFAAGGGTDVLARFVAEKLGTALRQTVIVDNRTGGGGVIATDYVMRAPKDGYTLLFQSPALAVLAASKRGQGMDIKKRLAPVSLVASGPFALVVNKSLEVNSVSELINLARSKPGKLNFGSPGPGTSVHLAGELFKSMARIDVVHVPYRGNAPALVGLMTNDIQFMFDVIGSSKPLAEDNKLKLLAVSTTKRFSGVPDTPTINESGLSGYESSVWMGVLAPQGTPSEVIGKLSSAINEILKADDIKKQLAVQGYEPAGLSPQEFGTMLSRDIDQYNALIRDNNLDIE
jgi:tripartite-type tricarboxylate transporter receptor subunit TctC